MSVTKKPPSRYYTTHGPVHLHRDALDLAQRLADAHNARHPGSNARRPSIIERAIREMAARELGNERGQS